MSKADYYDIWISKTYFRFNSFYLGPDTRKPGIIVCEQQRRKPACATAQSDQPLCNSLIFRLVVSQPCFVQMFNIPASLCGWAGWFEHNYVGNIADKFSLDETHF